MHEVQAQGDEQTRRNSGGDNGSSNHARKKRGSLAATLDLLLEPRNPVGRPGRPGGARNYQWDEEMDRLLIEYCAKWSPAKAKRIIARKIQASRSVKSTPRPDSIRRVVEYRMTKLGLPTGQNRKAGQHRKAKRWTDRETAALLGALGADATIESIASRTGRTVEAVRAKLARLGYRVCEIHGSARLTAAELAERTSVTPRQVRRWKERGWLRTKGGKITEESLKDFLRQHSDQIPFEHLPVENQVYLIDLGYPCAQRKTFRQNVREILDGIGRSRNPRRAAQQERSGSLRADDSEDDSHGRPPSRLDSSSEIASHPMDICDSEMFVPALQGPGTTSPGAPVASE